jgi:hypothetical protein
MASLKSGQDDLKYLSAEDQCLREGTSTPVTGFDSNIFLNWMIDLQTMGRKKIADRTTVLTHRIRTRVDDKTFNRLSEMVKSSNSKTVGQVARKILSQNRIKVYRKDISLEEPVQRLIQIRTELRSIEVNVNQVTRYFHALEARERRMFDALKVEENYRKVDDKVTTLITKVAELGELWLRR